MTVLKDLYGKPCKGDWMPKLAKILEHSSGTRQVSVSVFFSNHWLLYGRPFVSKLWQYTCGFFPHILAIIPATRYTWVFLSRILAFYSQVYDHFLTNAHIYAHKKNPTYIRYKQACGKCGRRKSSYKRHRIIPSAKNLFMYDGTEK